MLIRAMHIVVRTIIRPATLTDLPLKFGNMKIFSFNIHNLFMTYSKGLYSVIYAKFLPHIRVAHLNHLYCDCDDDNGQAYRDYGAVHYRFLLN